MINNFYAGIYLWIPLNPTGKDTIRNLIHKAFQRRNQNPPPHNSRPQFKRNRTGNCHAGWQN